MGQTFELLRETLLNLFRSSYALSDLGVDMRPTLVKLHEIRRALNASDLQHARDLLVSLLEECS